ncbi:GntR family transcriptional regulator [Mariluticola halotolerans]|uniref:GntR family transcriptional regulator n=1 Tax=Mariluticola halotolerans TaxID=2909283 RepID=UPI0026E37939|nr:GntR family transcriptional regulator [Mariluticola halotolerans]
MKKPVKLPKPPAAQRTEVRTSIARERFMRLSYTLRDRICMLDYPPGKCLSEETLAAEFGVSRTPLRRALGWLESQGLLTSVQGVGTIVTDIEIDSLAQVYQLRMELDQLLGTLSPVPPTTETIGQFQQLFERSCALVFAPDARGFGRLNIDFFHALMRLTDNEPLRDISERLFYQASRIWLKSLPHMNLAHELAIFSREIADIMAAVEVGDLSAAGHIRRSHISMGFIRLKKHRDMEFQKPLTT